MAIEQRRTPVVTVRCAGGRENYKYEQKSKLVSESSMDFGGTCVATPGVVEQVYQVVEEEKGRKCVARVPTVI
jgi:ethanolamine utilization protein EutA (predicted chaperonin)